MSMSMSGEARRFLVLVVVTGGLLAGTGWAIWSGRLTERVLQEQVAAGGPFSPVLFVFVATLLPLAWVPRMMTSIVAGALFGWAAGSLLALLGGVGGALAGYWMGHALGYAFVMTRIGPRGKGIVDFLGRHGFLAILLGRVSPVANCEAISLGSGLIGFPLRVYLPATVVGMAPGSILYSAFGASALTKDAGEVGAVTATIALAMTIVTGAWLWRLWRKDRTRLVLEAASRGDVEREPAG